MTAICSKNEKFRLYYTAQGDEAHNFIVVVEDNFSNSYELEFDFNNRNVKDDGTISVVPIGNFKPLLKWMRVFIIMLCSLLAVCSVSARDRRHEETDGQVAIYRLSPFERAVRCTKYFEAGTQKNIIRM